MQKMLLNETLMMSGSITLGDNGANAKSQPVKINAYSGDVISYNGMPLVFDLSSMSVKPRIQLDWEHDEGIGYLNKFDTNNGNGPLVCGGAIVPYKEDKGAEVVFKMSEGMPYQASVFSRDFTLEAVDDGDSAEVNGKTISGPVWVVRDWELDAVAICKLGKDADTAVALAASKAAKKSEKVLFIRATNTPNNKELSNMENKKEAESKAVEAEAMKVVAVEAPVIEAAQEDKGEAVKAVDTPAVEAVEVEKEGADAKAIEALAIAASLKAVEAVSPADTRSEFKQFVTEFGNELAASYFADGLSLSDATKKFNTSLKAENDELKKRLASVDRGAKEAVKLSASEPEAAKPQGIAAVMRMAGKKSK